ncbi:hypothetical protein JVU11DRAFT_124 [Chiua virens]|nr:hypothetical protein JVU11DRAFT_124 [Chiua virens]
MLSTLFCGPTKLTRIHDICGAWSGLGAALRALWQQTKVNSSSILDWSGGGILSLCRVATWPDPLDGFTSLDRYDGVVSLSPYIQDLYGNTTQGLANNTLYDVPVPTFVNASVDATTLNAHCGLLTNVSIEHNNVQWDIIVSTPGLDHFSIIPQYPPLPNQIWLTMPTGPVRPFITYLVSTAIELDESVNGTNHVYINGTFSPPGGVAQNLTTQVYIVACTFNTTTRTVALETPEIQLDMSEQPANAAWSAFSPDGDTNLTLAIVSAMATSNLPKSSYCQPFMSEPYLKNMTNFDLYDIWLGLDLSSCSGTFAELNSTQPYLLARDRVEKVTSQIAAGFVWLAGEFGEGGGGFDRQTKEAQITEYVLKWRLNINTLPVISSLCASVALCILVICMLWGRDNQQGVIPAAGMLEIMWFGSRSPALRNQMGDVRRPSVDGLRASSTFETVLWRRSAYVLAGQENFDLYAALPLCNVASHLASSKHGHSEDFVHGVSVYPGNLDMSNRSSHQNVPVIFRPVDSLAPPTTQGTPLVVGEHSIIIPFESLQMTTGLSALLQAIYTLYSAFLVFVLQRLAFSKMVSERRKLTTVHDVSGAWNGIGAAILILWQQRKVPSSPWQVFAVVTYLTSILVLHIASSSIIQWQATDNNILVGVIPSDLALPSSSVNISQLGWSEISPVACSTGQDSNLSTYGLSNSTVYDIPQVPENVALSETIVNATTFSTECGLVPNLRFLSNQFNYSDPDRIGEYRIGFPLNGTTGNNTFLVPPTM